MKTMSIPGVGTRDLLQANKVIEGNYWGLMLVRLMNPSVQGESSPPWLLLALTHWFFDGLRIILH